MPFVKCNNCNKDNGYVPTNDQINSLSINKKCLFEKVRKETIRDELGRIIIFEEKEEYICNKCKEQIENDKKEKEELKNKIYEILSEGYESGEFKPKDNIELFKETMLHKIEKENKDRWSELIKGISNMK